MLISFLLLSIVSFSEKKVIKELETQLREISISGLDAFVVENSDLEFTAMYVYVQNLNVQHIVLRKQKVLLKFHLKEHNCLNKK